jgi:hypothetical protein
MTKKSSSIPYLPVRYIERVHYREIVVLILIFPNGLPEKKEEKGEALWLVTN